MSRTDYRCAVKALGILESLSAFHPRVAGTPPLGLETQASDIDILCQATDSSAFVAQVRALYADKDAFRLWQWVFDGRSIVASFMAYGWMFEIFASDQPVAMQPAWRHFEVERRLLSLGGEPLTAALLALRSAGMKTEPAFWAILNGSGDPYSGMLMLYDRSDDALCEMLNAAGFGATV